MNDKKLGYILMALMLFLGLTFIYYFVSANRIPREARVLRFTEVGSLAVEDPVRMEGTLVGQISGFAHDDSGRVLVYISSKKPIPIRTSSRVAVKVKGVMGERFIEVGVGNPGDPIITDKDLIIDGVFEMGPSEAIAYMDLLDKKITELMDIMLWLRDGRDDGKRPFIVAFNDIVGIVDTLVWKLLTGLGDMEEGLSDGIVTAAEIAEKSIKLTADVSSKAPELIDGLNTIIVKVDNVVTKTDTLFAKLDRIVDKVEGNKLLWGEHVEKIQGHLVEIRKAVDDLRRDGLPLTIRVRF